MTTIDYAARSGAPARRAFALSDGLRTVFEAPALFIKRRFVAMQTHDELSRLSDKQLDDIGLIRAQIDTVSADMAARTRL